MSLVTARQVQESAVEAYRKRGQRAAWRHDPVYWATDHGIELSANQREILHAVSVHDRVAVRSCHDSGKSFAMAVLAAWWLDVHPQGSARVVTTAPTVTQVRGVLWVEINAMWERLGLPGRKNQSEVWFGSYQAAIGRKSSDYNPAAFSGWHAPHLLVIVDEADGVSAALWSAIDTLATNKGAKIVGIGNPDDPQSEFRKRQSDQPGSGSYHTIKIPAWSTPNFNGERVSPLLRGVLLSPTWVEEMRLAWGGSRDDDEPPDHPFWQSKVEAEYPDESTNSVIRLTDLLAARRFERDSGRLVKLDDRYPIRVGIDVAGSETGDESVVRGVRGRRLLDTARVQLGDPELLGEWLIQQVQAFNAGGIAIDADGVGFGYVGTLRRRFPRIPVTAIRSSASAADKAAFVNSRAEMWWSLREQLADRDSDTRLDFTRLDDGTAGQLLLPRYSISKGRIGVERKDELRKRMGRSPDDADAVVYALARIRGSGIAKLSRASGSLLVPRG